MKVSSSDGMILARNFRPNRKSRISRPHRLAMLFFE